MPLPDELPSWVTLDRLRRAAIVLLVLGVAAFLVRGATRPADPVLGSSDGRRALAGFEEVAVRVATPDGRLLDWCALLAATERAREQGLMGQRDLRGYDAMVFRFQQDTTASFYMFHTTLPLSIAFLSGDGSVVSSADMAPCVASTAGACPTYPATGPYRHAVEVTQGGLAGLGLVPGAKVAFPGGPCPA